MGPHNGDSAPREVVDHLIEDRRTVVVVLDLVATKPGGSAISIERGGRP